MPTPALTKPHQENPYVYKPKSYSRKRTNPEEPSLTHTPPPTNKKFKQSPPAPNNFNTLNHLDERAIMKAIQDNNSSFFSWADGESCPMENENNFTLPLAIEVPLKARRNPQLSNKIEIVSTDNTKIQISIH
jgi:hypothetical protein